MRIIAGRWRSRRLCRPRSRETRPIPDRIKEAAFSVLGAYYATGGALPPLSVADVFAGSGSMGLEALSRGAARCCFFECGREALKALERNLNALHVGDEATVVRRDAWRHAVHDAEGNAFDLVFLDPPYRDSSDPSEEGPVSRYLRRLGEVDCRRPLVLLHHRAAVSFDGAVPGPWRIVDRRTYGTGSITLFAR